MLWIRIDYIHPTFDDEKTAIVGVEIRDNVNYNFFDYLEEAVEKLSKHLFEKHGIEKKDITIFDYRSCGDLTVIQ